AGSITTGSETTRTWSGTFARRRRASSSERSCGRPGSRSSSRPFTRTLSGVSASISIEVHLRADLLFCFREPIALLINWIKRRTQTQAEPMLRPMKDLRAQATLPQRNAECRLGDRLLARVLAPGLGIVAVQGGKGLLRLRLDDAALAEKAPQH